MERILILFDLLLNDTFYETQYDSKMHDSDELLKSIQEFIEELSDPTSSKGGKKTRKQIKRRIMKRNTYKK